MTYAPRCPVAGKIIHDTEADGWAHVDELSGRAYCHGADLLNVYECDDCRGWHVGHLPHAMRPHARIVAALEVGDYDTAAQLLAGYGTHRVRRVSSSHD